MRRMRMNKAKDRKVFRRTSKPNPRNSTVSRVARGGIRF